MELLVFASVAFLAMVRLTHTEPFTPRYRLVADMLAIKQAIIYRRQLIARVESAR